MKSNLEIFMSASFKMKQQDYDHSKSAEYVEKLNDILIDKLGEFGHVLFRYLKPLDYNLNKYYIYHLADEKDTIMLIADYKGIDLMGYMKEYAPDFWSDVDGTSIMKKEK